MRWMMLLLLLATACGENQRPTVQDIRPSSPRPQAFREFFITLIGVEDPDGNVYDGLVHVKASSNDGEVELEEDVLIIEDDRDQTRGDVIFGVGLFGDIPLGAWKIRAVYEDAGGAEAKAKTAEITLTP